MFIVLLVDLFFFFKQKTAYEMRISDWSSDVCSCDLFDFHDQVHRGDGVHHQVGREIGIGGDFDLFGIEGVEELDDFLLDLIGSPLHSVPSSWGALLRIDPPVVSVPRPALPPDTSHTPRRRLTSQPASHLIPHGGLAETPRSKHR